LLAGMAGGADHDNDGVISVKFLDAYVAQKVKELTGGTQAPTTIIPNSTSDFPILLVK